MVFWRWIGEWKKLRAPLASVNVSGGAFNVIIARLLCIMPIEGGLGTSDSITMMRDVYG